jgi:D-alanyl-D-alanine carboxypeptidase/D-alanyl-D-alanine-endopeptidase (penicillin-binding protein 4)
VGAALVLAGLGPVAADPVDRAAPPVLVPVRVDGAVGAALDPALVTAAVAPLLRGGALGPGRTPARMIDVESGDVLFEQADRPTVPASTMKLVTAVSVLDALGQDATLQTTTVILDPSAEVPRVVVVGGGDPSLRSTGTRIGGAGTRLSPASLRDLADSTARSLRSRGIDRVRVGYDDSLFVGPQLHPTWDPSFPAAGIVAPVSALQVDQGRRSPTGVARVPDPAAAAARTFAEQLSDAGISLGGRIRRGVATADSVLLAEVSSPPIGTLVERMLSTSDNDYAEALARLGAAASGFEPSFDGVAARGGAVLVVLGVAVEGDRVADGSGLSRADALTPGTLTGLLRAAADSYGPIASGLAVAGATGSLRSRYDTPATDSARGLVRAKTGTLTGVVGLAGYASRADGRLIAFAILDDSVPGGAYAGRAAVDRAVATLVTCACTQPAEAADPSPSPSDGPVPSSSGGFTP